jgi:hypothetical protein
MFEAKQLRQIKRWFRRAPAADPPSPELAVDCEILALDIADRPGTATAPSAALASEFARSFAADFDAVLRVPPAPTLAASAGDLEAQLGLRLEDELVANLDRLAAVCMDRRVLIILEGEPRPELMFEGRCSTLLSPEAGVHAPDELRDAQRIVFGGAADWTTVCAAARQGLRAARAQGRLAECHELMERWHELADGHNDDAAQNEAAREIVWILEGWGRGDEAARWEYGRATRFEEQLPLF